jgi:hypothetical protein
MDTSPNHVHQPCTSIMYQCTSNHASNTYTKPCINHAPNHTKLCINHAPTPVPMHQPCTTMYQTCTINHAPTPVPTMHHTYTISCINHVPYHASNMYHTIPSTMYHKSCTMRCASTIYHITHDMSQSSHTPCTIYQQ